MVSACLVVRVVVAVGLIVLDRFRAPKKNKMAVWCRVRVAVDVASVLVDCPCHGAEGSERGRRSRRTLNIRTVVWRTALRQP
jgi:hypothetical protein